MFWVISVYFNIRNTLPKSGPFLLGHPVYGLHKHIGMTDVKKTKHNSGLCRTERNGTERNETNVRRFLEFRISFIIPNHHGASSKGRQDGHRLVPSGQTAYKTTLFLRQSGWGCLEHPPHAPDFTPSDVQPLGLLKKDSGGRRYHNIAQVQETVSQEQ